MSNSDKSSQSTQSTNTFTNVIHRSPHTKHYNSTSITIKPITLILTFIYTLITITYGQNVTPAPITPAIPPTESPTMVPYIECCDCTEPDPNPGCEIDPECEDYICNLPGQSVCCDLGWDQECARRAQNQCATNTPTVRPGRTCCECVEATSSVGCPQDPICQDIICNSDPYCCRNAWDGVCVQQAQGICLEQTPHPTLTPTTHAPTQVGDTPDPSISPITDMPTPNPTPRPTRNPNSVDIPDTASPTTDPTHYPTGTPLLTPGTSNAPATVRPTASPTRIPTVNPTDVPSNNPTINPTGTPSLTPSIHPITPPIPPTDVPTINPIETISNNPTEIPTAIPTEIPTSNPTVFPTFILTKIPTEIPTSNPTENPTEIPTHIPTIYPTTDPTTNPPTHPGDTNHPSREPTDIPTDMPTVMPSIFPSLTPFISPSISPIISPTITPQQTPSITTFNPTMSPTICPDCTKYSTKLWHIQQEDDNMDTDDCDSSDNNMTPTPIYKYDSRYKSRDSGSKKHYKYWKKKSADSDSSNNWKGRKSSNRKKGWHRRRRLHNDRGNKYWYGNDKSNGEYYNKCTNSKWGNRRRRLINNCNSITTSARRRRKWYHWADSDESDSYEEGMLTEVCMTYNVNELRENCGELNSLILPLCNQTKYNNSDVTADDITDIVTSIYPNSLNANGIEYNDMLGVEIEFNNGFVDTFILCLKNISIDYNYYRNNFKKITIADWVVFEVENRYETCTGNDGLPCFNFVFTEKCPKQCICNQGITEITMKYTGDVTASMIVFYYDDTLLCVFSDVQANDLLMCSVLINTVYKRLQYDTKFEIIYDYETIKCVGYIDTSCQNDIYFRTFETYNFNRYWGANACAQGKIQIIGYKDMSGNICDEEYFNENSNNNGNVGVLVENDNALLGNDESINKLANITFEFYSNWKMEIIIIFSVLVALICGGFYYLFYSTKLYYQYNKARPIDQSVLTETNYNNDSDSEQSSECDNDNECNSNERCQLPY